MHGSTISTPYSSYQLYFHCLCYCYTSKYRSNQFLTYQITLLQKIQSLDALLSLLCTDDILLLMFNHYLLCPHLSMILSILLTILCTSSPYPHPYQDWSLLCLLIWLPLYYVYPMLPHLLYCQPQPQLYYHPFLLLPNPRIILSL
jgi:hypothetical protein